MQQLVPREPRICRELASIAPKLHPDAAWKGITGWILQDHFINIFDNLTDWNFHLESKIDENFEKIGQINTFICSKNDLIQLHSEN